LRNQRGVWSPHETNRRFRNERNNLVDIAAYIEQEAIMGLYRAFPALAGGNRYYVPTACGTREKAIAEAEKWIAHNGLDGEVWTIEIRREAANG
jgi:hypothetical protein